MEQGGPSGSTSDLCSGGTRFEFWPGHRLSWKFSPFFSSNIRQMSEQQAQVGRDRFHIHPNPLFIILCDTVW